MKLKFFLFAFSFLLTQSVIAKTLTLSGRVIDAQTHEPLPGASISLPDLRLSVIADEKGEFTFRDIPEKGKFLIEIKYIGYQTMTQRLDLSAASYMEFALQVSTIEAREVVVTGTAISSDNRKNSTAVTAVSRNQLIGRSSGNLIDAIAKVAGVSQITTGGGISKPVIRGLSSNRVVTLVDGAKQEGQQWGDEHGIEVDQFNVGRVEVLRGAASLLYGSDALGGVINILEELPPAEGQIRAELISNYSTNNGLNGNSVMLHGNSKGFVWQGRASSKNAYSYNAPGGRIANTGFNEKSFSSQLGLNKKWGYAHLNLSSFRNNVGLPDFQRNSAGYFEDEQGRIIGNRQLKDRQLMLPYQDIRHYKVALNSNLILGGDRLQSTLAYQDNQRRELEDSRTDPALFFDLKTYSYDLKYHFSGNKNWEPVIGVSGSFQENSNRASEMLIPDYRSADAGVFVYAKKSWQKSTFNLGARYNYRRMRGSQMQAEDGPKFNDFSNSFSNLSAALGFTYEFNSYLNFKANAGSAFRAPNIAELSSDGKHEGTFRYEIGDNNLNPEKSYYADAALEFSNDYVHANVSFYNNYIDNYIFSRQSPGETISVEGETLPVFRYVQDNANLYGAEATLTFHPVELLHFENNFSYTHGQNRATQKPLPFIPAATLRNELSLEPKISGLISPFFTIGLESVFAQHRVDSFESPSKAYALLNASLGTGIKIRGQLIKLNISANNLFDKAYYDHLSRFKPGRLDEANPESGYYNPGRNIAFAVYVPLRLK